MKASNENELNIIDMDSMDTNALPIIEDSDLTAAAEEGSIHSDTEIITDTAAANLSSAADERFAAIVSELSAANSDPYRGQDGLLSPTVELPRIAAAYETRQSAAPVGATPIYIQPAAGENTFADTAAYDDSTAAYVEATPIYIQQAAGNAAAPEYTEDSAYTGPAYEDSAYMEDTYAESSYTEEPVSGPEYTEPEYAESVSEPEYTEPEYAEPAYTKEGPHSGGNGNNNDPYTDDHEYAPARPVWARRNGNSQIFVYFVLFFVSILYYEFLLRLDISGSFSLKNIPLLAFVPAEALFCASLSGWFKKHPRINGIISAVIMFGLGFYYFAQLVYFRLSGSLLSVSLMNMGGEAMGNFGWTIKSVFVRSIPHMLLMTIPVILTLVLSFIHLPKESTENEGRPAFLPGGAYKAWLHPLCTAAAFGLWTIGGLCLALGGRDRESAYYVFKDSLSDTDSSSNRLGTLATTLVEASAYYLGTDSDSTSSIGTVDMAAIDLGKKASPAPAVTPQSSISGNVVSDNEVPERLVPDHAWENEDIDFNALKELSTDATTTSLCDYFESRVPTRTNEYTGIFEDYNLIYICAEAFSNYGIDKDITPTLYKMAHNGVVLNNFYNSFPNTTTNGEFAFATSLWPDVSRYAMAGTAVGSFAQSANSYMPYGLGDQFTNIGVESFAYHNYYGDYYKRCYTWPNLGYTHMKFLGSGMVFTSSWPASDLELVKQSIDDYVDKDRFNTYYMTFSGHGPYNSGNYMYRKNIDKVKELANGRFKSDECLGYFCGEYELELAMEYLLERLEEEDQLDKTVIVLIGDHFPYYLSEAACTEFNGGTPMDAIERNHSTCIIYNAGLEEPIECDTYCCNVDILPTILNLFNIEFDSRLYIGTDVFSDGIHRARLYNGSFLTEYVTYDKTTGKKTWTDAAKEFSEDELDAYFNAMQDYTTSEYSASLNMMKTNFYLFTWQNSGLLTKEEIDTELAREASGRRIYADEAAAEAARLAAEAAAAEAAEAAAAEAAAQEQQQQQQNNNNQEENPPEPDPDPNWQPDPSWFED